MILQWAAIVWASPASALGLAVGLATLVSGGAARRRSGVLEFHGGAARWLLERMPVNPIAMTLGHTVLGVTGAGLDVVRNHELVHVRQYERWGPLLIPAYLLASLVLRLRGRDPYRDNPFEVEAFRKAG
ncbi:MAG TPA: hypothetical protein VND64_33045 [Pirellulales bacterium]|nr:hypothetical protein [Pirellulales bacterium]